MQTPHTADPRELIFRVGYAKLETHSKFSFFISSFVVKWSLYIAMTALFMCVCCLKIRAGPIFNFALLGWDSHGSSDQTYWVWDSEMNLCQPAPTWLRRVLHWMGRAELVSYCKIAVAIILWKMYFFFLFGSNAAIGINNIKSWTHQPLLSDVSPIVSLGFIGHIVLGLRCFPQCSPRKTTPAAICPASVIRACIFYPTNQ